MIKWRTSDLIGLKRVEIPKHPLMAEAYSSEVIFPTFGKEDVIYEFRIIIVGLKNKG